MDCRFDYSTLKTITITYNVLSAVSQHCCFQIICIFLSFSFQFCGVALIAIGFTNIDASNDFKEITGEDLPKVILGCLILIGIIFLTLRFIGLGGLCYEKRILIWTVKYGTTCNVFT